MTIPTTAPSTRPPTLEPTTTPVEIADFLSGWEPAERQAVVTPGPPLCWGPLDHEIPLASVREMKKGDAQERETVQLIGFMSYDMILNGGWRAGAIIMVNGGVPFLGIREISEH